MNPRLCRAMLIASLRWCCMGALIPLLISCGPEGQSDGRDAPVRSAPTSPTTPPPPQPSRTPLPLPALYGATVLQTSEVTLDSGLARDSMGQLRQLGANAVVLVPFLRQARPQSDHLEFGKEVTDQQLIAGIRSAHAAGMSVILKPQILITGSWAGAVDPGSAQGWVHWFADYQAKILHYAGIAASNKVEIFVIGTELKRADKLPYWRDLIVAVRKVYPGKITYAAHNLDGIEQYAHWEQLDMLGVTLYPPLGRQVDRNAMLDTMRQVAGGLDKMHARFHKPVLVAEVGIPSMSGAQEKPWDYSRHRCDAPADTALQALVLGLWLEALNQPWISGVFVWNWLSDPYAGGRHDTDYTVQHKPAEAVLRCRWGISCDKTASPAG
ncbi:hypothetical protein [Ferriphaselus sp. R-1]|uniref:glycoside hydrolase family 113 n=1 Tax=Ferriphaselus sp. R-1 TaxID=1485544 RepID=UPI001269560C|nr:hypothetical protein [Ferriphaselus sp. R-1]